MTLRRACAPAISDCPRLVRLAEGVELLEQAVVQVGDVVVAEAGMLQRLAHARDALARAVLAPELGAGPMRMPVGGALGDALLARGDGGIDRPEEA